MLKFLFWHYTDGVESYMHRWYFALSWVAHYFSLTILPVTLFSPWKRLVSTDDYPGFNLQRLLEEISFNIISRFIGFFVRAFVLCIGILIYLATLIAGLVGLVIWFVIPFVGAPEFFYGLPSQTRLVPELFHKLAKNPNYLHLFFASLPGKFVLSHLNINENDLTSPKSSFELPPLPAQPKGISDLVNILVNQKVWQEDELKKLGCDFEDFQTAAMWWDTLHPTQVIPEKPRFNRPGIGLELLFGYTPNLNRYSIDLSLPQSFSHHLIGREELVNRIERIMSANTNIILTGEAGVGKKTVVLELAHRAMSGELGKKLSYQRLLEFDYHSILSGNLDINSKKTAFTSILTEASAAGNVILVIKDLHRLVNPDVEGIDFTDILEPFLERRKLKIIAISSPVDYERFLASNARLHKFFDQVEVLPPTIDQAKQILLESAYFWEKERRVIITVQALRAILEGSDRYVTETPFPEKALEILDKVVSYAEKNDKDIILPDDINSVLSEITGISLKGISNSEKNLLSNLEAILHQYLVGQNQAVDLISKTLRSSTVGAKDPKRPIGSFLFLGPTGVGKTQAAKALAKVYYGDEDAILRFDMAEYAGPEGFDRLIGSQTRNMPGSLALAIKNRPASLLLLDEIEKSPPLIFNLFLSLLDEGQFTDAFGKKIVCRHLFVIATSNAGSETIRQLVSNNSSQEELIQNTIDEIQKTHVFSPEFINRFDGVVVFQPLNKAELQNVARMLLTGLQSSLKKRNLYFTITDEVCTAVAEKGYSPQFGARPLRRLIDIEIGDVIGKAILSGDLKSGDKFNLQYSQESGFYVTHRS